MKLLLDEMHAPVIADHLQRESFDVVAVAAGANLRGMSDEDLLAHAAANQRALVTENVVDFMPLAMQWASTNQVHSGLVLTNPQRFHRASIAHPGDAITALREFLTDPPTTGESWIWWL